jgi:hypothetical protein
VPVFGRLGALAGAGVRITHGGPSSIYPVRDGGGIARVSFRLVRAIRVWAPSADHAPPGGRDLDGPGSSPHWTRPCNERSPALGSWSQRMSTGTSGHPSLLRFRSSPQHHIHAKDKPSAERAEAEWAGEGEDFLTFLRICTMFVNLYWEIRKELPVAIRGQHCRAARFSARWVRRQNWGTRN